MNDEPMETGDIRGVISLTMLLRDLALIKGYAFEKNDERIYLCADNIENELNRVRYGGFILDTDW